MIDDIRRRELGPRWLESFEYVAQEMYGIAKERGYVSPGFEGGLILDV